MSYISAWVASVKVGNQTAKQLLQFLASNHFNNQGYFFSVQTLAEQCEVTVRAIQKAKKFLSDKKIITIESCFDKSGRQLSDLLHINVPKEFVENFYSHHPKLSTSELRSPLQGGEGERRDTPEGERRAGGRVNDVHPNNNINNNKNIKSFCEKAENQKKHSFAGSMDAMAREKQVIQEHRRLEAVPIAEDIRGLVPIKSARSANNEVRMPRYVDWTEERLAKEARGEIKPLPGYAPVR